jgi:hypothetical protein
MGSARRVTSLDGWLDERSSLWLAEEGRGEERGSEGEGGLRKNRRKTANHASEQSS